MPHLTGRAWLAGLLAIAGLVALGVTIAGAQGDDTPVGTDPLSTEETEVATGLALGSNPGEATGLGPDDVVLLVERHEELKRDQDDGRRRADVYVYSYDDDVLTQSVVDVASSEVVSSVEMTDTQLPLAEEERPRLDEVMAADTELQRILATEYRQVAGEDLTDPAAQLVIQPIVFRGDSSPGTAGTPAARCGVHRCFQLLIETSEDLVVDLLPIVDLSAERVVSREGFFQ